MLTKIHLLALEPDTRAFTLVGAFMGYFALLELGINAAIGEVLEVKGIRRWIVGRNMGFDDKIKTLRTLVDVFIVGEQASKFDELAKNARKCGEMRNLVAHTAFRASEKSDGVEFFPVAATSKFHFPEMDWSIDDFLKHIDDINKIDNDLRSIESRMSIQRVAEALMSTTLPIGKGQLGSLDGLFGLGSSTDG